MSVLVRLFILACTLPILAIGVQARAEVRTATAGGNGGGPFTAVCPGGYALVGAYIRSGSYIDAIGAT